jgi:hypothetical protein
MKRIRIVGLCLIATFAISIVASSVASAAQPVFYTKAVVGESAAGVVPFKGTLGAAFLEGKSGTKITCTGGTATGEVTGPTTTENNVTKFTGCETSGFKCNSAGAVEGEIVTAVLKGTLGNVTATLPAVRLFPQVAGRGGELAAFACASGAVPVKVKGSVIGSLSGASGTTAVAGKIGPTQKLSFAEAAGVQKYTKFLVGQGEAGEEQLESSVSGNPYEKSGQSVVATLTSIPAYNLGVTL